MKNVLITGASRGIGAAIARELAPEYNLILNYNSSKREAELLFEELRGYNDNMLVKADVANQLEVRKMFEIAKSRYRDIDILINNAGIGDYLLFTDTDLKTWRKIFSVNVEGVYNCLSEVLPSMISNKRGIILNISSIWGSVGASMESCYSASKGAVDALTKSLAKELGPSGIRVNAIAPGSIDTDLVSCLGDENLCQLESEIPMGRLGTCKEIAQLVSFMISDKNSYMTGQIVSPNGGFVV